VAQRRAEQALQSLVELRIALPLRGVRRHRDRPQELQPRFPQIVRGMMTLERRLGVPGAPVELRQGQRQAMEVESRIGVLKGPHEHASVGEGRGRVKESGRIRENARGYGKSR
jgi:hypothetical protein